MIETLDSRTILTGLALFAGVVDDLRSRRVHNKLVLGILAVALVAAFSLDGFSGIISAGATLVAAFAITLPLYLLRAIGGGDFKLVVAVSPLLNWYGILVTIVASLFWGALLGIVQTTLKGDFKSFAHNLLAIFWRAKPSQKNLHKIPYTIALLFGWLTHLVLAYRGITL